MGGGCSIGASFSDDAVILLYSALLLMHYFAVLYHTSLYYAALYHRVPFH